MSLSVWLNSLVCYLSFASFNAPYNPVRLMYEKRAARIQCLILCLIIWCTLWSKKHGVAASSPTIWTSTYALESTHCNRLLTEPSCWAQTVHMFTLRLYVSCDLTVTPCAGCVFLFAFLCVYLRPRRVLHGPSFWVMSWVSCCLTDRSTFSVICSC